MPLTGASETFKGRKSFHIIMKANWDLDKEKILNTGSKV